MISFTPSTPKLQVLELTHVGCAVDFKSFPYEVLLKRNKGNACNPLVCCHECSPPSHLPANSHGDSVGGKWGVRTGPHMPWWSCEPQGLELRRNLWSQTSTVNILLLLPPSVGLTSCPFILFCIYTILFTFSLAENLSIEAFVRYKEAALQTIIFCLPCTGLPVWNNGRTFSLTVSRR